MDLDDGKKFLSRSFSSIDKKLTLLFMIVAILAPALAIYYFYSMSISILPEYVSSEPVFILEATAALIIILIAVNAGIIGYLVSKSISKPIKKLYQATKQLEKGNFDVKTNISSNDEIGKLAQAFNKTTSTLSRIDEERTEIEKAKTQFISITSHELRSPMTPMKAQLQMLENEYFGKLNQKQKKSLKIIIRNADRLDNLIVDFLEISRIESARLKFNFQKINLKETLNETVEFMKGFAQEKNINLMVKTEQLTDIEADPDRISQVIRNLINNAIKFSPNNSKIEIQAKPNQDHILFSVNDHGCGLTKENQIKIFEPFFQVEKSESQKYDGTGLGLAICRGIIESQKGKIWVESKPGQGSTFYFTVPMQPVRNIEPIKILFSPRSNIEKKIKLEFENILGPLGKLEFNELKNKNALWKDDIFDYIDSLTEQYILTEKQGKDFKNRIGYIFGVEKENVADQDEVFSSDNKNFEVIQRD